MRLHLWGVQGTGAGEEIAVGPRPGIEAAAQGGDRHGLRWGGHVIERLAIAQAAQSQIS